MERAGRLLAKLKLASHGVTDEQMATAAWPRAVGKTIAQRTSVIALVRNRLVVAVEDNIWQRQLWTLRGQILGRMEEALGRKIVEEVEFRIAGPGRKPVRSELTARLAETDDADGISDSGLRNIYKAARRKATA